jgi:hypothetical protein
MELEDIGYKTPAVELTQAQAEILRDMLAKELGYSRLGTLFKQTYARPELSEDGKALERILEVLHLLLDDCEIDGYIEIPLTIRLLNLSKRQATLVTSAIKHSS